MYSPSPHVEYFALEQVETANITKSMMPKDDNDWQFYATKADLALMDRGFLSLFNNVNHYIFSYELSIMAHSSKSVSAGRNPPDYEPRMRPNQPDRLNVMRTIVISLGLLSAYTAWAFFNTKIPILLAEIIESKTIIGIIMAFDNILAIVLQPFFGHWSDRTQSRFGRRMPFVIIGSLLSAAFLALVPWAFLILGDFILTIALFDLSMNIWRSPALTLLADYTPDKVRVKGNSLGQFIASWGSILGIIITPVVNNLFPSGDWNRITGFLIVGIIMVLLLVAQLSGIKETPTGTRFLKVGKGIFKMDVFTFKITSPSTPPETQAQELRVSLWDDLTHLAKNKSAFLLFLAVLAWYFAFSGFEAFATQFGTEYLYLPQINAGTMTFQQAETQTNLLLLAFWASIIFSALPAGLLSSRIGRKKTLTVCLIALLILMAVMSFVVVPQRDVPLFMIGVICVGFFWMTVIVTSIPMIWSLAPPTREGTYTGIYYTFTQIAGVGSPFLLGGILDLSSPTLGANKYLLLFPFMLLCIALALVCVTRVRHGKVNVPLR